MAELLVRRTDKTHPDPYMDAKQTKRGDVICVQPDGWPWGTKELANPDWIILLVPGVSPEDLSGLLAAEPETNPAQPSRMLQPRAFKLDLDHSEITKAGLKPVIADLSTEAVTPRGQKTLREIEHKERVRSYVENVTVLPSGTVITERRVLEREVLTYAVVDLHQSFASRLPPAVTKVGPICRVRCVATIGPDVVSMITTRKPALKDPAIF